MPIVRIESAIVKLIKKDGTRQPFDRTKIKRGLEVACWKRPVSDAQLESIVSEVQNELEGRSDPEIESREVGELVMRHLRALDQVAYVRFASVYRQFEDVHDFVHELKSMLSDARRREEIEDENEE
jgi:transcriptional repressor NrdR